jgi:pimeloyl-ACP methyl ester carboxylesterase
MLARHEFEEVEFRSEGVILSGTVVLPKRVLAAIVLVHGSGQETRRIALSEELADLGIATLTYDKRGVDKSGGIYIGPEVGTNNISAENLSLLAVDVAAAMKELARWLPSDPPVPIGLMGGSQAGWIIPLAASRSSHARFMVIWSGPIVTAREQLRFQFYTGGQTDFWDNHTEAKAREHIRSDPDRYEFVDTDPLESLRKLSLPGLWLFGDRDSNVPVDLSIERLHALIESGKPYEYEVFPRMGHFLPTEKVIPVAVGWLKKQLSAKPSTDKTRVDGE